MVGTECLWLFCSMQGASGGASKGKVMTSTGGPSALMGGANGLHLNSPAQLNPVGTLALPIQISERYLGTYLRYCPSYPAIELLVVEPVQCRGHWWRWFWFFDEFWFTDDFLSGNGFVF